MNDLKIKGIREIVHNKALIFLSSKPRTESELNYRIGFYVQKYDILNPEEQENMVEDVVHSLKKAGLVDDDDYVKRFIEEKINSRKSSSKMEINQFLMRKGIPKDLINKYMNKFSPNIEEQKIKELAEKKLKTIRKGTFAEKKRKVISYITKKGFPFSLTASVVDTLIDVK